MPLLAQGRACGKLILFGEHFVVHGAPALALPLRALQTTVDVETAVPGGAGGGHVAPGTTGPRLAAPDVGPAGAALAGRLLDAALERLAIPRAVAAGWQITARASAPPGQGLGSSASFAVALLRALVAATGRTLEVAALNEHALALERVVHGTPSGVDNTVVAHERAVWLVQGAAPRFLDVPRPPPLVLASSGATRETAAAVERVRERRAADPAGFAELSRRATEVASAGRAALEAEDGLRLGVLLDENHELLRALGVSTPALDELTAAARRAGARGAKLTGAGLGGFVVALAEPGGERALAAALRAAGAPLVLGGDEDGRRGGA